MPHSHPSPLHQAAMSLAWGIASLLLVLLGVFATTLLPLSAHLWPLAWLFETPAIATAVQSIRRGDAAQHQATKSLAHILSTAGLCAASLACTLGVGVAVVFSFYVFR